MSLRDRKKALQDELAAIKTRKHSLTLHFERPEDLALVLKGLKRAGVGSLEIGALRLAGDFAFRTPANLLRLQEEPFWRYPKKFALAGKAMMRKYHAKRKRNARYKENLKRRIEERAHHRANHQGTPRTLPKIP